MGDARQNAASTRTSRSYRSRRRQRRGEYGHRGKARVRRLTVVKWRARFIADRAAGLADGRRAGAPRKISDEAVEQAVQKTLKERPRDATHWSTRSLAKEIGISSATVHRIWR